MTIQEMSLKGLLSKWGLPPKPCDSCNSSPALLFCLPHSASLCLPCDADLHSPSASPHPRVSMCDVCEQSPACVTCKADSASLCASCDREIHDANPLASRHHRLPVLPFFDTLSATDTSTAAFLIPDDVDSFLEVNQHLPDGRIYGADSVVPIQTTKSNNNLDNRFEIDFAQSKLFPFDCSPQCISQSISSSEIGVVPEETSNWMSEVSNLSYSKSSSSDSSSAVTQPLPLSGIARAARVMRYREKRKNRRFDKTVRYASRKAYAETRPRIKGRFVKRDRTDGDADGEEEQMYGAGGFILDDPGVVPLF